MPPERERLEALARRLGLEMWTCGICLPCLTFVAFPLDKGDERQARREARKIAGTVWSEGWFEASVLEALAEASARGDEEARIALEDVRQRGFRSDAVEAMIFHLGEQMVVDMHSRRVTPLRESDVT